MVTCRVCNIEQPYTEFDFRKDTNKYSHECKVCRRARVVATDKRSADHNKNRASAYRVQLKKDVLAAYGNACSCCGETEPVFLALDHKFGGGRKHRLSLNGTSTSVYADVRRRNYPPEFQVLCHNCNIGKYRLGACPHKV